MKYKYKYDISFSYASEQKLFVEKLSNELTKLGVSVFVDYNEPERFWGSFLPEELRKVYFEESEIILIFLSHEYREKAFTSFEGRIAMEKSLQNKPFLIIKIDDVNLPWLNTAIGFINWNDYSTEQIANMLIKKLGKTYNNKTDNFLNIIQNRVIAMIEHINMILNYSISHYIDNRFFSLELINNDKIFLRFSITEKNILNSKCYQVYLVKYPLFNDNSLNNGEIFLTNDGKYLFYNYGFFHNFFTPLLTYQNIDKLMNDIETELLKCGESFYD